MMRRLEIGLAIEPVLAPEVVDVRPARATQQIIDQLDRAHPEAGVHGVEPLGQALQHLVV